MRGFLGVLGGYTAQLNFNHGSTIVRELSGTGVRRTQTFVRPEPMCPNTCVTYVTGMYPFLGSKMLTIVCCPASKLEVRFGFYY